MEKKEQLNQSQQLDKSEHDNLFNIFDIEEVEVQYEKNQDVQEETKENVDEESKIKNIDLLYTDPEYFHFNPKVFLEDKKDITLSALKTNYPELSELRVLTGDRDTFTGNADNILEEINGMKADNVAIPVIAITGKGSHAEPYLYLKKAGQLAIFSLSSDVQFLSNKKKDIKTGEYDVKLLKQTAIFKIDAQCLNSSGKRTLDLKSQLDQRSCAALSTGLLINAMKNIDYFYGQIDKDLEIEFANLIKMPVDMARYYQDLAFIGAACLNSKNQSKSSMQDVVKIGEKILKTQGISLNYIKDNKQSNLFGAAQTIMFSEMLRYYAQHKESLPSKNQTTLLSMVESSLTGLSDKVLGSHCGVQ